LAAQLAAALTAALACAIVPLAGEPAHAAALQVGPTRAFRTIAAAAAVADDGGVIEVDAGAYPGDVVTWAQDDLTVRAIGGQAVIDANGRLAAEVGIWQVKGRRMRIEGFTFQNASGDASASGVRLTAGSLTVVDCRFFGNPMGLLTANEASITLDVVDSEFGYNGAGDGYSHNLYAGRIGRLTVTGSYFHHTREGHLLKSRAAVNLIAYNRLADGDDPVDSRASYELDLPDGGVAAVVGNVLQQSEASENGRILDFAAESTAVWPSNRLYVAFNTFANHRTSGATLVGGPVAPELFANNLVPSGLALPAAATTAGNQAWAAGDLDSEYRPTAARAADWAGLVADLSGISLPPDLAAAGASLIPARNHTPPLGTAAVGGAPTLPGAWQPAPDPSPGTTPPGNVSPPAQNPGSVAPDGNAPPSDAKSGKGKVVPKVTVRLVKKKVAPQKKAKAVVKVKAKGVAKPTGKVRLTLTGPGKSKKSKAVTVVLKPRHKGVLRVALPRAGKAGRYKVTVAFLGAAKIAPGKSKTAWLRVK
jgi:hypothetical protein